MKLFISDLLSEKKTTHMDYIDVQYDIKKYIKNLLFIPRKIVSFAVKFKNPKRYVR